MAPYKKKRKEPVANASLLDFFSGAAPAKKARVSAPQQSTTAGIWKESVHVPLAHEVIVIDSDGDDDQMGCGGSSITHPGCELGVSQPPLTVNSEATFSTEDVAITFGKPSALLEAPLQEVEVSSTELSASQLSTMRGTDSDLMFGTLTPLLGTLTFSNQSDSRRNQICPIEHVYAATENNLSAQPQLEETTGECVGVDNELATLEVSDETFNIEEDEGVFFEKQICPVCSTSLVGTSIAEACNHVNGCLDTTMLNHDPMTEAKSEDKCLVVPVKSGITFDGSGLSARSDVTGNLYTVLMTSHKENEAWSEVDAGAVRGRKSGPGNRRRAPFYKVLQGMPIAVDAFCYGNIPGVTAYFLTHAHSDHYTSLSSNWRNGPIYCSEETAKLIIHMLAVDPKWVRAIRMDTPTVIPDTGGVSVTLIEANHCPGSCLFFFEGQQTVDAGDSSFKSHFVGSSRSFRYLHCGDFRASPQHVLHPAVKGKHIDHIYLDTTYLDPKYTFPPQPLVIAACAELARKQVIGDSEYTLKNKSFTFDAWIKSQPSEVKLLQDRMLVVVGTYSVGKERIVKAIAAALNAKIYCDPRKAAILKCQTDTELHDLLTTDPAEGDVHILPLSTITSDNLRLYLEKFNGTFSRIIGFRPTGWTYAPPSGSDLDPTVRTIISSGQSRQFSCTDLKATQKSSYAVQIFGVPYSEHSSFFELTCFAISCDWGRIIPTVNVGTSTSRAKMTKWINRWELERRRDQVSILQPRAADYW